MAHSKVVGLNKTVWTMLLLISLCLHSIAHSQVEDANNNVQDSMTVRLEGSGGGFKEYHDPSGWWQKVTYVLEVSFKLEATNPQAVGDSLLYTLSRKIGRVRFQGWAEDHFFGENTRFDFDLDKSYDLEIDEGSLLYSMADGRITDIDFSLPPPSNFPKPNIILFLGDSVDGLRTTGTISAIIDLPRPWKVEYIGNAYNISGTVCRIDLCEAMRALAQTIHSYQEACINVVAAGDVEFARSMAKDADLGQTAKDFAVDLLAGDIPRIVGKMTHNSAGKTAFWLTRKMGPRLIDKVRSTTLPWIGTHVVDWAVTGQGIDWHWDDEQIADYIRDYFSDAYRLGELLEATLQIADDFCAHLPEPLPDDFPAEEVIQEINGLRQRIGPLIPQVSRPKEGVVYWSIPGMCSFDTFGNLNPVLLGASSYAAEDLRFVGHLTNMVGTVTDIRRKVCATWGTGGGLVKIISTLTVAGAPPGEAVYWGRVGGCTRASGYNEVLGFVAKGLGIWKQFENVATLHSDVLLAHDLLAAVAGKVLNLLGNTETCSTNMTVANLDIPNVTVAWLEDFVDGNASVTVTNNGSEPGKVRGALYVWRRRGKTYDDLVVPPIANNLGDLTISPGSTSEMTFDFEVPAGNLLFADNYYAVCYIIGSSGTNVKGSFFRACQPAGCFFDDSWSRIMEGRTSTGESQQVEVQVDADANRAEFVLGYQGSEMDLHIYDSGGRHVGFDYETGAVDMEIPGAQYSGADAFPERIEVPVSDDRSFTVQVVAVETNGPEDFVVLLNNVAYHPATLVASPMKLSVDGTPGEETAFLLNIGELGEQEDVTGLQVTVSELAAPSGATIPSSAVSFDLPESVIAAGTEANIQFTILIPPSAAGPYTGLIDITSQAGEVNVPLEMNVITPDISVDPIRIDFDNVNVGSSSDRTITVSNDGTADLVIGALTDPSLPFTIVADGCSGQTFPPSASAPITVRFSPTLDGPFSSSFAIPSNDPDENPVTVSLFGNGVYIPMPAFDILKANISQNKKTPGQKAKISCSFQLDSDKDISEGLAITVGSYEMPLTQDDLIDKKGKSWQYKRPKGQPKQGIKKLKIKWDKKGNVDRDAVKVSIYIDDAVIFPERIPEGSPVNVDISIRHGLAQGAETIEMTQKKPGKLTYKARK